MGEYHLEGFGGVEGEAPGCVAVGSSFGGARRDVEFALRGYVDTD